VERIENIQNFKGDPAKPYMVINTEWGNFGADGVIDDYLTQYDKTLHLRRNEKDPASAYAPHPLPPEIQLQPLGLNMKRIQWMLRFYMSPEVRPLGS
jgi:hypothetical protein